MRTGFSIKLLLLSCSTLFAADHPVSSEYNRLLFAGDVMFSRGVRSRILAAHDPALPFRKLAPLMSRADLTFINLETPFSDRGPYFAGGLIFHAAPEMIAGLELAGVDVASIANNHARDCGAYGVAFTANWLRAHGIEPVGRTVLTRHGVRFGFLAYTFDQSNGNWKDQDRRIALADTAVLRSDINEIRPECDVLIVSMHHGVEYQPRPSHLQIDFAHTAIDAGADLVIGHHPHVIEPRELYRGKPIYYSIGNFVFDQFQREATQHGEMVEISFVGKTILTERVLPVRITPTGPELERLVAPDSAPSGQLHVTTELRSHSRQYLLGKGVFQP